MSEMTMDRLEQLRGAPVLDSSGDKIGSVEEIFYDEQTNRPEWIGIGTGFLGTKRVLVPLEGASAQGDSVTVRYSKDQVKDSPDIDSDEISQERERELYSYYGIQPSEAPSDTVLPARGGQASADVDVTSDADSMTRSEEELRVGKVEREAGQARLRKWVETEPVQMDVELQRETARVTREPIDQPVDPSEIGEEQAEVTLREEQPVVAKEAVAKERIGLETDVETERQTVTDEVRKERVEVEGDEDRVDRV
jgi:stress response protein YsnF